MHLRCHRVTYPIETVENHLSVVVEFRQLVTVENQPVFTVTYYPHICLQHLCGKILSEHKVDVMVESVCGVCPAPLHLCYSGEGCLLLLLHCIQLLLCCNILRLYLLQLNRGCGIARNKVLIALAVLCKFLQPYLYLCNGGIIYRGRGLCCIKSCAYYIGAGHCILKRSLGLHKTNKVLAVVQHKQGISLLYSLMLLEIDLLYISGGA